MSHKMLAVMKTHPRRGAELVEAPVPSPAADEVLVKVEATSICGTDFHIYEWNKWAESRIRIPQIMGHELAGEVVEIGSDVKALKEGDYVSAETHIPCGHCYSCLTGSMHVCLNMKILGVDRDGAFAEYITVPEVVAWKNDRSITPPFAAIQEPLGNAIDTVLAEDIAGKTVLITGLGPIGLMAIELCRACGATTIIGSDPIKYRRDLGATLGATALLDPTSTDLVSEVRNLTDGTGVEVLLEMSGNPRALDQGMKSLVPGGRISLLGLFNGDITLDINNGMIFKSARIYGITGRKMFSTWFKSRQFLSSKVVDLSSIITHTFKLSEFEKGMEHMAAGTCAKVVLIPDNVA
ncbi:L-threonine 3-dehydrogenase [bacterium]|nr:L-threonine 3-dehydrogenase [candidate division CSSED10-310 bacterium]